MRSTEHELTSRLEAEGTQLAAFILALVGNREAAEDVFQATCLEVWRLRDRYVPGSDFGAWSRSVARNIVRRHWRSRSRDRLVFSDEAVAAIESSFAAETSEPADQDESKRALARCLDALGADERTLIDSRYRDGRSIVQIAKASGRTEASLKMRFVRLRKRLAACVRARLSESSGPNVIREAPSASTPKG